jgi:AcrR family transcriptional regulator
MPQFRRARRPEHNQQHRDAILNAVRRLGVEPGADHVNLGHVAAAAGLAKSNIVRNIGTREEIYRDMAAECWHDWRDAALQRLRAGVEVVGVLVETSTRGHCCVTCSATETSPERNVSVEAAGPPRARCAGGRRRSHGSASRPDRARRA